MPQCAGRHSTPAFKSPARRLRTVPRGGAAAQRPAPASQGGCGLICVICGNISAGPSPPHPRGPAPGPPSDPQPPPSSGRVPEAARTSTCAGHGGSQITPSSHWRDTGVTPAPRSHGRHARFRTAGECGRSSARAHLTAGPGAAGDTAGGSDLHAPHEKTSRTTRSGAQGPRNQQQARRSLVARTHRTRPRTRFRPCPLLSPPLLGASRGGGTLRDLASRPRHAAGLRTS